MTLLRDFGHAANDDRTRAGSESHFQRLCFLYFTNPGALPQASDEVAPLALNAWYARLHAQCLIEVLNQIVGVFEADGHAQQAFGRG